MNNGGWGLRVMIALCAVLVGALLIVVILISTGFFGLVKTNNKGGSQIDESRTYNSMELQMINASKKYIKKFYNNELEENDPLYIRVSSLQNEKLMDTLYDVKDSSIECSGYVKVIKINKETKYESYMKCGSNYTSEGYTARFDG
ncbi:MAG: hypothetical protein E7169_05235 [Firmicutes bacterium]|nr:hypothetical protein [Bacillota bacterium]